MNGMTNRLKTALVRRGHTEALMEGAVTPRGFDFDFEEVPVIINAFRRMVRELAFDISEMAMTTYLCARAHGKQFTAIPVFPMRAFHHGAIVYNTSAGVHHPRDLEGKKVGVNRGYTVTTGLWARAILQHDYGVDLNKITWVLSGDEHVAEYRPPSNVVPIEPGKTMEEMLTGGEIAAAINVQVESPDVKPLIPNAKEAGLDALRRRGLYPINHTVVVRMMSSRRIPIWHQTCSTRSLKRSASRRTLEGRDRRRILFHRSRLCARHGNHRRSAALRHRIEPEMLGHRALQRRAGCAHQAFHCRRTVRAEYANANRLTSLQSNRETRAVALARYPRSAARLARPSTATWSGILRDIGPPTWRARHRFRER